jgi:cephalosporin-C deacetylase-like acetyl esterase
MCYLLVIVAALSMGITGPLVQQTTPVTIDGKPGGVFWESLPAHRLAPIEEGVPAGMGGEVRAAVAGKYLYLGATLPEPSGRVVARSIGINPVWEGGEETGGTPDARRITYGAPDGEDFVRFFIRAYNQDDWMVQVGPIGGYSIKWTVIGRREWYTTPLDRADRFLVAAETGTNGWSAEAAIPLDQLGSPLPGQVWLSVERNRAGRPGTPAEHWRWPAEGPMAEIAGIGESDRLLPDPIFRPPVLGNRDAPIEAGFRKELPAFKSGWADPEWRDVQPWLLFRNEAAGRLPNSPTQVKLVHDGHTLAVLARCIEPGHVVGRATDRGISAEGDDSFQVYLTASGSSYVEYAINPAGYILGAAGHSGNPRLSRPHPDSSGHVQGMARQEPGEWLARLDLPLEHIRKVLSERGNPKEWRVLLVRTRAGHEGEPLETSVLPITQSVTPLCPARYRRLKLVEGSPSQLVTSFLSEPTGDLASFPTQVFNPEQRRQMDLNAMVEHQIRNRVLSILTAERRNWNDVKTLADWEHFRDLRIKALAAALGKFPERTPLKTRVTSEYQGNGYRRENLVYQSRPGLWVTTNLYLPLREQKKMPGIILVHSHHAPKTQFELQDMGILWARAGCAVLVMDQLGFGERIQIYPWDREAHNSSHLMGMQLQLADENLMAWIVWDIMRGVDLLFERSDVNHEQMILMGAVAGGGDPAAVTAALDQRVAAVVPFNFGEAEPEELRADPTKNQWPLDLADPGWGDMVSTGALRGAILDQFFPWTICASVAPRRFIYSFELGWNVEDLPAWARYQKVYGMYNALDHLADAHGFGPFPGPGEAWNIGPAQRRSLYPTLERWFGIPIPFADARSSIYDDLKPRPTVDRRPPSELAVLTPAVAAELKMRSVHELVGEEARQELQAARGKLEKLPAEDRRRWLQIEWAGKLGDIEPARPQATVEWTKEIPGGSVTAIRLSSEPGITVPMLLLQPATRHPQPVVIGISQEGKDLFVQERSRDIEGMLKRGTAVCLPDVRGTGETEPGPKLDPDGDEIREHLEGYELMLGDTLLGKRLKDLRTVIAYLASKQDLDSKRIGLWGESFEPANPPHVLLDEQVQWQVGPEIEEQAEPLGGLLAILGALYEDNVRTVAVHGGLATYLSILDDQFAYVPADVIIPGALQIGDIPDLVGALAPHPILLKGLVDGRNRLLEEGEVRSLFLHENRPLVQSHISVARRDGPGKLAEWFSTNLQ